MKTLVPFDYEFITDAIDLLVQFEERGPGDPFELGAGGRQYQTECFDALRGHKKTILRAPTGCGKSLIQVFLAADEVIESDYQQKQLIAIPMRSIARSFAIDNRMRIMLNGKEHKWEVGTNCCDEAFNKEIVQQVKSFLLSPPDSAVDKANRAIRGNIAVVTYAAVLAALKDMTETERRQAIRTTSFRIDEAHHIARAGSESTQEWINAANLLGRLCKEILRYSFASLHLCTATFFRGDKQFIVSKDLLKDFKTFRVEFMTYWKLLGLKEFKQQYKCYGSAEEVRKQILAAVRREPKEPPLIILPSAGQGIFRKTVKSSFVKSLVADLEKILGTGEVIDLISPECQDAGDRRVLSAEQDFKAIVTCMKGREGMDWPRCSRIHNVPLDGNVLLAVQKNGRALRRSPGKTNVIMFNYIEDFPAWDGEPEEIRRVLSDRFATVAVVSMLDDMFHPIVMPSLPVKTGERESGKHWVTLEDVYGDKRQNIIIELVKRFFAVEAHLRDADRIDQIISKIIDDYRQHMLVEVEGKVLLERLRKELVRSLNPNVPKLKIDGFLTDAITLGWDQVVREHLGDRSPFLGSATTDDLNRLQKTLENSEDVWWEQYRRIEKMDINDIRNMKKDSDEWKFLYRNRLAWLQDKKKGNPGSQETGN